MVSRRRWSEEEVQRLRSLYPSEASINRVAESLPGRSLSAIRQMASRLGLRRSLPRPLNPPPAILVCSSGGDSEEYVIRCPHCGSWMKVPTGEGVNGSLKCWECGYVSHLIE